MPRFNLGEYLTVEDRLKMFWRDHPNGGINTEVVNVTPDHKSVVIRAEAWFDRNADQHPAGVGIAQEYAGGSGANATSHIENADTSAVGRALANCGYSGDKRASREEMQKVERGPAFPSQRRPPPVNPSPEVADIRPCFKCGLPVSFGVGEGGKQERFNADGGLHFKTCQRGPTGFEQGDISADPFAGN